MIYRPRLFTKMWDTWMYYHDGIHYLYHLHMVDSPGDGVALATSDDGVHWEEHGEIIEPNHAAEWLGTGAVWSVGDRFMMNYSEKWEGVQRIYFAQSEDLVSWHKLDEEFKSTPDPQWYDDTPRGRWDCIYPLKTEDGYLGYLTARPWRRTDKPRGLTYRSFGMVASNDGVRWRALPPPVVDWQGASSRATDAMLEVGAIERIGERFFLMLGSFGYLGDECGMYAFIGDSPRGPFRPDTEAFKVLTSRDAKMAYFSRFYRVGDELLVNHHSISRSDVRWFAPLKRATVDTQNHLRLTYWEGNDALKAKRLDGLTNLVLTPAQRHAAITAVDHHTQLGLHWLPASLDYRKGVVIECTVEIAEETNLSRAPTIAGFIFVDSIAAATAVLCDTSNVTRIGSAPLSDGQPTEIESNQWDRVTPGLRDSRVNNIRILARHSLIELYINDRLVQCYSLYEAGNGRLGVLVPPWIEMTISAWTMQLSSP